MLGLNCAVDQELVAQEPVEVERIEPQLAVAVECLVREYERDVEGAGAPRDVHVRVAGARGNLDGTPHVAWSLDRDTPYVPSPLLADGVLYFLKTNSGILTAVDARSGKPFYQNQRLEGVPNVFASPVAAKGRIYIAGREGSTIVRSDPAGARRL